ncbi:NADH:ubiquinone oxidoreductase subunit NDUFA12 [Pararhodospirillum oryzae]|uniref:NADH:ubiquinone oxidoreductase subunit NDUFA12 n=1 Tax=Pararhodospirillum oryzae TaxID=478448 RepID=A0A512H766_9PROT|nr:NADH:ubiquinone oxidoreductase subunit NDUFA12 [Pararhodospirillum oryzae]GEO81230.1 NADH:ubiquinone oxidoreductase subunit NDUFA12 [Pararhodospirillum oryzae]
MNIGTRLYTRLNGELVGEDAHGNRYYQSREAKTAPLYRRKRWVVYKGRVEASKVPAEWHGWLHYTCDAPLDGGARAWVQPHLPNLTGTPAASVPAGDERRGGQRPAATGDYQAWRP